MASVKIAEKLPEPQIDPGKESTDANKRTDKKGQ